MSEQILPPLVCISVLNWNGAANTTACLASLRRLDYTNYCIVVVDNASADDSIAQICRAFPDIEIIQSETNLGYAHGNKLALDWAVQTGADLFWILNNDSLVETDSLQALVDAYQQYGDAIYGSISVFRDHPDHPWQVKIPAWGLTSQGQPDLRRRVWISGAYESCFPNKTVRRAATVQGNSLLIPMRLIERYGFIDTTFFLYSEEGDYSLRLAKQGVLTYLVPASVVYHAPGGAQKNVSSLKPVIIYYQTRNRLTLLRRHASAVVYLRALLMHLAHAVGWYIAALKQGWQARQTGAFVLRGIVDAVRGRMGKTYAPEDFV